MKRALVLGSDTRSFLAVVRSLGRARIEVHVAWCPLNAPAAASRYIHTRHALPPYDVESLSDLLRREHFDLVIPCDDFAIVPLQSKRVPANVYLLSPEVYAICSDKQKTYDLAAQLEIPLPQQRTVTEMRQLQDAGREFGWPLVLKPAASVTAADPGVRHAVRKAWTIEEARSLANPPLLVQQNFIGVGVGVEVLCHDGQVLFAFQHERVHEPMSGGGSSYRKSVPLSPDLLAAARRLMQALRYTGVAMVEFKVNHETGAWILIEINSRFWGSLPLSLAAGADFPRYLFEMLVDGRTDFPRSYREGVYARNWMLDLRWLARNLLADRSDPTLMSVPLWKVLLETRHLFREHSDTLTFDDPGPALAEIRRAFSRLLQPARLFLTRRRRARRALEALRTARKVLFLCKGNICRSPFAAEYLRSRAPQVEVDSAGYYRKADRRSPPQALDASRRFGVDLSGHRSRILSVEQVRAADAIFIFEPDQEREIQAWCPEAVQKVHYLGALIGRNRIGDPWGQSVERFKDIYGEIKRGIDAGWDTPHYNQFLTKTGKKSYNEFRMIRR